MVKIEINDEVWDVYKRSWALMGIRPDEQLIRMLESELWRSAVIFSTMLKRSLLTIRLKLMSDEI